MYISRSIRKCVPGVSVGNSQLGGLPSQQKKRSKYTQRLISQRVTHHCEVHDLQDPDGECKVDNHGDKEEQDEEVEAAFAPTVDAHWVWSRATRPLQGARLGRQDILLLGHLKRDDRQRGYFIKGTVLV